MSETSTERSVVLTASQLTLLGRLSDTARAAQQQFEVAVRTVLAGHDIAENIEIVRIGPELELVFKVSSNGKAAT